MTAETERTGEATGAVGEPTEEMIAKGAYILSENLCDMAPLREAYYRIPARDAYKAMRALEPAIAASASAPSARELTDSMIEETYELHDHLEGKRFRQMIAHSFYKRGLFDALARAAGESIPNIRDDQLVRISKGNLSTTMSASQWFDASRVAPKDPK